MKKIAFIAVTSLLLSMNAQSAGSSSGNKGDANFQPGSDIEQFWMSYAESKGGLTWGKSSTYPEYEKVNEGDTLLIQLDQGNCLMEFFHSRWRRANDVRRWDDSINSYGGCPYVFD